MAHTRSEKKIRDLMSASNLQATFFSNLARAAEQVGATELDLYRFINGSGQLSHQDMLMLSMRPHATNTFFPPCAFDSESDVRYVEVAVDPRRPWHKAVKAAGPDTPWNDPRPIISLRRNPVFGHRPMECLANESGYIAGLILRNFANGASYEHIRMWGELNKLTLAHPLECLAVGEHHPWLVKEVCRTQTTFSLRTFAMDDAAGPPVFLAYLVQWYATRRTVYVAEPPENRGVGGPYDWVAYTQSRRYLGE